jgi:AsmA protein
VAPFALDGATVTGGSLRWIDHAAGRDVVLTGIAAEAALPAFDGPATITARARIDGAAVGLEARVDGFAAFVAGRVVPMEARFTAGGSTLALTGRAGASPAVAEGRLEADLGDLAALAALAGAAAPDLPEGLGRRDRRLTGQVTLAPEGSVHLRGGTVQLDGNALAVEADLTFPDPRPRLAAQVSAGTVTLRGLGGGGGGAASPDDPGWSAAAIDVSALGAMDAEVSLAAEALDLGLARTGPARVTMVLDRARAVFETKGIAAYGGAVAGQFVVNGRGGLSVGGDVTLAGMAMEPLLRDLAGWDRLIAAGDLRVKFLGVGNSMAAIMASLSGDGRLTLGRGEIRGLDLAGMLRTLDTGFVGEGARTIFDSVAASFTMDGGVLRSDDLKLVAPLLDATGSGTVGIGARVLDYRLVPRAMAQADGTGGVSVPLLITGPWSAPRFRLDLKALADQKLEEEKARLAAEAEARAKAALEAKAAELGVVPQEGESLEDAARRRAQEAVDAEAQRALRRLLGQPEAPAPDAPPEVAPEVVPEAPAPAPEAAP